MKPYGPVNEDGTEVIDVGEGRARSSAGRRAPRRMRSNCCRQGRRRDRGRARPARAGGRRVDKGAGRVVARCRRRRRCRRYRRPAPRCPRRRRARAASASAYSWFGPPRPLPRMVTVSSPPDRITRALALRLQIAREPGMLGRDLARFAFELVAEQDALVAGRAHRLLCGRANASAGRADQREGACWRKPDRPASAFRWRDRRARA